VLQQHEPAPSKWTTVDYKSVVADTALDVNR
jgi:hypothetical protein